MTFYSILFAVVFLASVQDFFRALFTQPWADLPFPAVVSVLVFTDTIYTSHYLDNKPDKYSLKLKLLDLLGLLLLVFALTVLSTDNSFVKLTGDLRDFWLPTHALFWISLFLYFLVTFSWHKSAGMKVTRLSYAIAALFLLAFVLSFIACDALDTIIAVIILVLLIPYLVIENAGVKRGRLG